MKKNKKILRFLIASVFILTASCNSLLHIFSAHSLNVKEPFLAITPIISLGANPVNSLWIDKNGNAEYLSHFYDQNVGLFRKRLSSKEMKLIQTLIESEMGGHKEVIEKMEGNEEVQPCTIFLYEDTVQRKLKSKKSNHIFQTIKKEIGIDSLKGWKYLNGMSTTKLQIKKWNIDSSYTIIFYNSMGNMVNISHYNKRSKRVSQQFKHNLSAYDVYRLFEVFNKQIENAAEKDLRKPMGLYEVTGDLEINPHSKADKHKKETKVLYKLNYNSSVKSINQINKELHILIENVLKK